MIMSKNPKNIYYLIIFHLIENKSFLMTLKPFLLVVFVKNSWLNLFGLIKAYLMRCHTPCKYFSLVWLCLYSFQNLFLCFNHKHFQNPNSCHFDLNFWFQHILVWKLIFDWSMDTWSTLAFKLTLYWSYIKNLFSKLVLRGALFSVKLLLDFFGHPLRCKSHTIVYFSVNIQKLLGIP